MTNFIVIKLLENCDLIQQTRLIECIQEHYKLMVFNQFGFIVLAKLVENLDINLVFPLSHTLLHD